MENKKLNIVVIEDENLLRDAIERKMKVEQIEVHSFRDGRGALDYLENTQVKPDLIWLDYYLPDMNGDEFMEKLKLHAETAAIPVMVVSNSANPKTVERMNELGAKKFLLKAEHRLSDIIDEARTMIHA